MNLTLTKMFWYFDIGLAENKVWAWSREQEVFALHEALPLNVRIRPRA